MIDPEAQLFYARHLLAASVMAAPATIVIAKILRPETEESLTHGTVKLHVEKNAVNVIEAAANGASDGVRLAINVGGMLLAFLALMAFIDWPLNWLGQIDPKEEVPELNYLNDTWVDFPLYEALEAHQASIAADPGAPGP